MREIESNLIAKTRGRENKEEKERKFKAKHSEKRKIRQM